jgi:hypothetical protein
MKKLVISSGHGKYVRGAAGVLDEVDEARRVVERVADELTARGVDVMVFHDNTSTSQSENLDTIVDFHNSRIRDLDVSVHFNCYVETYKPMGTEVLYVTQIDLADRMSEAIASCGFIDRGPKKRTDLSFLNNTEMPAILIETCFVDSEADAEIYRAGFSRICGNIADVLAGNGDEEVDDGPLFSVIGKASTFGGPNDEGVAADEGLAFIQEVEQAPYLFLPYQPPGTTGLARRLNPRVHYIACRWDYEHTPKDMMLDHLALVRAVETGMVMMASPADWGPHEDTGRAADLSPALMEDLGIQTDDEVEVIFPWERKPRRGPER